MSLAAALRFIGRARDNDALGRRIRELGEASTVEEIVQLGAEMDLAFTVEELRTAFKYDWAMRWARYGHLHQTADEQESRS